MADDKPTKDAPEELSNEALEQVQGGITLDNGIKVKRDVPSAITLDNGIKVKSGVPSAADTKRGK